MSPKRALALYKHKILRLCGLTAQQGWARLILDRFYGIVLFPGDPAAATREPDSALHERQTFFFPGIGRDTVNAAGGRQHCLSANFSFRVPPVVLARQGE